MSVIIGKWWVKQAAANRNKSSGNVSIAPDTCLPASTVLAKHCRKCGSRFAESSRRFPLDRHHHQRRKGRMIAKHLGAIVLSSGNRFGVRRRVLAEELELHDIHALVNAIVPRATPIAGLVYATVGSSVDDEMIGWMASKRMIVRVDVCPNIADAPVPLVRVALYNENPER